MKLVKTIVAKVVKPTNRKYQALEKLWSSWNFGLTLVRNYRVLRENTDLPSFYCREINWKIKVGSTAPVVVPKDALNLKSGGVFAPWFASIPTPDGRIRLPLRMSKSHSRILRECEICDSQLIKHGKDFFLHIIITKNKNRPIIPSHGPVLAVDLGERVIATSVALIDGAISFPRFHGREVRTIRRHHAWLRKQLGRRKLLRVIKRLNNVEHRKVEYRLHFIAADLVNQAKELGAVIAIGDLSGISRDTKQKRMNRIVNSMPFNRLSYFIEYKAAWAGVPVIKVDEAYSSRECHICKQDGKRISQPRFICNSCGEYNADLNGALNIGNRALAYMAIAGASRIEPMRGTSSSQV